LNFRQDAGADSEDRQGGFHRRSPEQAGIHDQAVDRQAFDKLAGAAARSTGTRPRTGSATPAVEEHLAKKINELGGEDKKDINFARPPSPTRLSPRRGSRNWPRRPASRRGPDQPSLRSGRGRDGDDKDEVQGPPSVTPSRLPSPLMVYFASSDAMARVGLRKRAGIDDCSATRRPGVELSKLDVGFIVASAIVRCDRLCDRTRSRSSEPRLPAWRQSFAGHA